MGQEFEALRARLEQVLSDDKKRQECNRKALAQPLRRGGGGMHQGKLLESAFAHQAHAAALDQEAAELREQVQTLTLELGSAEEKVQKLGACQQVCGVNDGTSQQMEQLKAELAHAEELRLDAERHYCQQQNAQMEELTVLRAALTQAEGRTEQFESEQCSDTKQ